MFSRGWTVTYGTHWIRICDCAFSLELFPFPYHVSNDFQNNHLIFWIFVITLPPTPWYSNTFYPVTMNNVLNHQLGLSPQRLCFHSPYSPFWDVNCLRGGCSLEPSFATFPVWVLLLQLTSLLCRRQLLPNPPALHLIGFSSYNLKDPAVLGFLQVRNDAFCSKYLVFFF